MHDSRMNMFYCGRGPINKQEVATSGLSACLRGAAASERDLGATASTCHRRSIKLSQNRLALPLAPHRRVQSNEDDERSFLCVSVSVAMVTERDMPCYFPFSRDRKRKGGEEKKMRRKDGNGEPLQKWTDKYYRQDGGGSGGAAAERCRLIEIILTSSSNLFRGNTLQIHK